MSFKNIRNIINLLEGLEDMYSKYYSSLNRSLFNKLVGLDPTYRGGDVSGNYAKWIIKLFTSKNLKEEDFYKVTEYLQEFEQKKKYFSNKDIFQFKTLPELSKALAEVETPELTKNQKTREIKKLGTKDAELVYQDLEWEISIPKTYEASCNLGTGTRWCTATTSNRSSYDEYSKKGNLYIIINKSNPKEKYQLHFETGQYMDKDDDEIELADLFEYSFSGYFLKLINSDPLEFVKKDYKLLQFIENPSEQLQLEAVQQNGYAIEYIENPSEQIKLEAVKQDGLSIQSIKNPSEAVQLEAVKQNGHAIRYIKNPSEAVQLEAVQQNGYVIEYIKNPSEEVQLEAVRENGWVIIHIKNPSEAVQLEAVKQNSSSIEHIENPSEQVQLEAVRENGYVIEYIDNPTQKVLDYVKSKQEGFTKIIRLTKQLDENN